MLIVERNGIKLAMLAYTADMNGNECPKPCLINEVRFNDEHPDFSLVERHVRLAKERGADAIIASVHWGWEFEMYPHHNIIQAGHRLAEMGVEYVVIGHSERRQYYGETSETLNLKMARAYAHGLTPVYCVGENLEEREAGKHFDVVKAQIEEVVCNLTPEQFAGLVIAYEPVWAIGTGKTATADQAQEIHAFIRKVLADKFGAAAAETPILYGGSCKPSNAAELFAKEDVDGGLIGGAALKAEDFLGIGQGFAK